jgi:hypothetical protein
MPPVPPLPCLLVYGNGRFPCEVVVGNGRPPFVNRHYGVGAGTLKSQAPVWWLRAVGTAAPG